MEAATFSSPQTWASIESPDAARILTNVDELRFLEPFLGRERTVKEAADALGVTIDDVYYRVRRAERAGVLRVSHLQPRAGRAVKRYTSSASGFFVPYRVVPDVDFEALVLGMDLYLERTLIRNILIAGHDENATTTFGLRVFRDEFGRLKVDAAYGPLEPYDFLKPENPATYSAWPELNLDFEDAKALAREMDALWRKYAPKRGAQPYLVRLGVAPLLET